MPPQAASHREAGSPGSIFTAKVLVLLAHVSQAIDPPSLMPSSFPPKSKGPPLNVYLLYDLMQLTLWVLGRQKKNTGEKSLDIATATSVGLTSIHNPPPSPSPRIGLQVSFSARLT